MSALEKFNSTFGFYFTPEDLEDATLLPKLINWAARNNRVDVSELVERKGYDRLWLWFEISRAGWVTIPRVLLHEMPDEWQDKMAALLEEYEQTFTNWPEGIGTRVQITDCGHLTSCHNWLNNYRYPCKGRIEVLRNPNP